MSKKPTLVRSMQIPPITLHKYERYLPTAFDESLSILEKMNKVIEYLTQLEMISNELVEKWNVLIEWVLNEGLEHVIIERLEQWFNDGSLETILENVLLRDYAKMDWVEDQLLTFKREIENILSEEDADVTVGKNGDYLTITDAINYYIKRPFKASSGTITLLPDFIMKEQVIIRNKDLRYLTIIADHKVIVESTYLIECVRVNASPEFEAVPVFYGQNSVMPTIEASFMFISADITSEQCFDCNTIVSGIMLDNSTVTIKPYHGFTHFPFCGLIAINGSTVVAHHCDFSHNGNRHELAEDSAGQAWYGDGVRTWNSTFSGSYAKADRCGDMGFHFSQGSKAFINKAQAIDCGHHALLVTTGSICSARDCKFTDTIDDNVVAYAGSKIDLRNSDCSRSKVNYGVIATRGAEINFENGIANECGFSGIMANRASSIDATDAIANRNTMHGIECANNSRVDFSGGQADNNQVDGIHVTHASTVQARNGLIRNNVRNGILAFSGVAYANGSTVTGNNRNLEATRGGSIFAYESILNNAKDKGVLAYGSKIFISYSQINNSGGRGLEATQGGEITAEACTISGSGEKGVLAYSSKIHLSHSTVSGSGDRSVEATQGGEIVASDVTVSGIGNSFSVYSAGRIFAPNCYGTANRDLNQITEHGMIISDTLVRG